MRIALFVCVILIFYGYFFLDNVRFCSCPGISKIAAMSPFIFESLNFTETILKKTRLMIKIETSDYNFTHSGVNDLEDLMIESGGTPVKSLIVSTWRSGSSFLGELLNAVPGTFYNYEPFMIYKQRQIRGHPFGNNAVRILKDMFNCNFENASNGEIEYFAYVRKIKRIVNQIKHNRRLWEICSLEEELFCYNATVASRLCRLFPFLSVKVVRFRLQVAEPILIDQK